MKLSTVHTLPSPIRFGIGGLCLTFLIALGTAHAQSSSPEAPPAKKPPVTAKKPSPARKPEKGAPTREIIERVMRALWEEKARPGMDGEATVTFQDIQIGRARNWSPYDGGGGVPGDKVWIASVDWTLRTHYRSRTDVRTRHWIVSCFKNGLDKWVVQDTGDVGQTEKHTEEPTTMQ